MIMHFFFNSIQLPFFQIVFQQNSRMMAMKRISTPMTQAMAAANREENKMTQGKRRERDMLRHRPHGFLVMTASKRKKSVSVPSLLSGAVFGGGLFVEWLKAASETDRPKDSVESVGPRGSLESVIIIALTFVNPISA